LENYLRERKKEFHRARPTKKLIHDFHSRKKEGLYGHSFERLGYS
jgi:hypothetical protein